MAGTHDDDALLGELAAVLADVDEQERAVAELGRGAFTWRTVDDDLQLASLSYDSAADHRLALRSSPLDGPVDSPLDRGPRTLVFSSAPLSIELEILGGRMMGQLIPPCAAVVLIEGKGFELRIRADKLGFFIAEQVPRGPVRITCETPDARLVTKPFSL